MSPAQPGPFSEQPPAGHLPPRGALPAAAAPTATRGRQQGGVNADAARGFAPPSPPQAPSGWLPCRG